MNFIEAYKALIKGKKIRQPDWDKGGYIKKEKSCDSEDCYACDSGYFSEEDGTIYKLCGVDYLAKDWEIYEEECKLHTFEEALKALKNGAKIRITSWKSDVYISLQIPDVNSKMTAPYMYVTSRYGQAPWMPTQIEIMSDQWEIKEERK